MEYGNEPNGKNLKKYLTDFVNHWKSKDSRRVYTGASGWPYLANADYNSSPDPRIQRWGEGLKSIINAKAPNTMYDWKDIIVKDMIVLVVLAIACYAMSLGPVTWVLLSEIFPNRIRAVAVATSTFALWVGSFTLTYTFPLLNNALGSSGTFWIYTVICGAGYVFFLRALPETKGKSLETLEKELIKK